jgi:hypothetical protein
LNSFSYAKEEFMNPEMLQVTLGREDLFVLLQIFHAPALPGLEGNPWEGMPAGLAAAALVSAERSLRARGILLVKEDEKRIEVEPVTMALVGSCLKPRYSLLVTSQARGQSLTTRFYHIAPHLTVEHSSPEVGLYQFTGVAEQREMVPRILTSLQLSAPVLLHCPPAQITEATLIQARSQAQAGDTEYVHSLLRNSGVADTTADALATTLANPLMNGSIVKLEYSKPPQDQAHGFSILEGTNGLWAMTPTKNGELKIKIESVSTQQVEERLTDLLRD